MKNKNELTVEDNSHTIESEISPEPFLRFVYEKDPDTGRKPINTAKLSNGICSKDPGFLGKVLQALKCATGSNNPEVAERILSDIAWGMASSDSEERNECGQYTSSFAWSA